MPFKIIAPTLTPQLVPISDVSQPKTFYDIVTIPGVNSNETTTNFLSMDDVFFNPDNLSPGLSLLDIDGTSRWSTTFSIESEAAIQANVRKARLVFYLSKPFTNLVPSINASVGNPNIYYNTMINAPYTPISSPPSSFGVGGAMLAGNSSHFKVQSAVATAATQTLTRTVDPSVTKDDNRVKQVDISLGITDQMVTDYNLWVQQQAEKARPAVPAPAPIPTQVWTAQVTEAVVIENPKVVAVAVPIDNSINLVSAQAEKNVETNVQQTNKENRVQTMTAAKNPTAHLNAFYSSGPSAGPPMQAKMISYSLHGASMNMVQMTNATKSQSAMGNISANMSQNAATQKADTNFAGQGNIQELYAAAYDAKYETLTVPTPVIKEVTFESTEIEHRADIDVPFSVISPRTNKFYVKFELLDKNDEPKLSKVYTVDFRSQIKPMLTPTTPPVLAITEFSEGKVMLELTQTDPMATDLSVYRMIADPEDLSEATWSLVGANNQNISEHAIQMSDEEISGNVAPKVVVYEARCSGPLGAVCPTTETEIKMGVSKPVFVPDLGGTVGECSIIPVQTTKGIEITVDDIPDGVVNVFLKKDHINTSRRTENYRRHPHIRVKGTNFTHKNITNSQGGVTFEDLDVIDRGIYRYYAQFDWKNSSSSRVGRTNSVTDEYIEFRTPPQAPVLSYLQNTTINTETGEPIVTFEFGASLSSEGIEALNEALGETGTSAIFIEELKKDRSLLSNLILCSITRKDTKTGDTYTWPLSPSGLLVDSRETNNTLQVAAPALQAGRRYIYTVKVHLVNPEGFFREALMKMPAATRQIITDTDPNFVEVSAKKYSDSFAQEPGMMQSPTAQQKIDSNSYTQKVASNYIGISHTTSAVIPKVYPQITDLKLKRSVSNGSGANVLTWRVNGDPSSIHTFQINIVINRGQKKFPLTGVSSNAGKDGEYQFRDELYSHEIVPISYELLAIYTDQTESAALKTEEIEGGTTQPITMLNSALKAQVQYVPQTDYRANPTGNNLEKFAEMNRSQNAALSGFSFSSSMKIGGDPHNQQRHNAASIKAKTVKQDEKIRKDNPKIDKGKGRK